MPVLDVKTLPASLSKDPVDIAVLVTPAESAQGVTEVMVKAGIKAILNFAPIQLTVPEDVAVKNVNLALELETLSYALAHRNGDA